MGSLREACRRPGGNANCCGTVGCLDTVFFFQQCGEEKGITAAVRTVWRYGVGLVSTLRNGLERT